MGPAPMQFSLEVQRVENCGSSSRMTRLTGVEITGVNRTIAALGEREDTRRQELDAEDFVEEEWGDFRVRPLHWPEFALKTLVLSGEVPQTGPIVVVGRVE